MGNKNALDARRQLFSTWTPATAEPREDGRMLSHTIPSMD